MGLACLHGAKERQDFLLCRFHHFPPESSEQLPACGFAKQPIKTMAKRDRLTCTWCAVWWTSDIVPWWQLSSQRLKKVNPMQRFDFWKLEPIKMWTIDRNGMQLAESRSWTHLHLQPQSVLKMKGEQLRAPQFQHTFKENYKIIHTMNIFIHMCVKTANANEKKKALNT